MVPCCDFLFHLQKDHDWPNTDSIVMGLVPLSVLHQILSSAIYSNDLSLALAQLPILQPTK